MFRGLDPKAQSFLMDRSKDMEADYTRKTQEIAPLRNAAEKWTPLSVQYTSRSGPDIRPADAARIRLANRHEPAED